MSSTYKNIPQQDGGSDSGITDIDSIDSAIEITRTGETVHIGFDPSGIVASEANSVVNDYTAGETISALQVVYYDSMTGRIFKASNVDLIKASGLGIAKTSGNIGEEIEVLQYGLLQDVSFSYSPAQMLFITAGGIITTTAPTSGYLTRVGRAITPDTILVLIESPITL